MNKNILRIDGYYKSPPIFDKYDLRIDYAYLKFFQNGGVEYGRFNNNGELSPNITGEYQLIENKLRFSLALQDNNYVSTWFGIIKDSGIQIQIESPDFEDMPGLYTFEEAELL